MRANQKDRDEAIEKLRTWFPKGSTVYTVLRSVARSGLSRTIGIISVNADSDEPYLSHPNYAVSQALGLRWVEGGLGDGVHISGCGMDMGFEIAYRLGNELYGDGYALKHRWL